MAVRTQDLRFWWAVVGNRVVQASSAMAPDNSASLTSWEVLWDSFAALAGSPPAHFR